MILVSYSDSALVYGAPQFQQLLFDTTGASATGSVYDYYLWASGGRLRVLPTIVGVVTVPNTRNYYGNEYWGLNRFSTQNDYTLVRDALNRVPVQTDWSQFDVDRDWHVDMLWVVHAGIGGEASLDRNDLWSITSQMSNYWYNGNAWETPTLVPGSSTQHILVDRFSILPEKSGFRSGAISEIGVYCHEFGHALGLPDLYDTDTNGYPNAGPGHWSLMAVGVYGGDGVSPEYPVRPGAWCERYLGWSTALRPVQDTTIVIAPIASGGPILDLSFQGQGAADHFLVENRRREGFDRNLPGEGLVIYHANESAIAQRLEANLVNAGPNPALIVVEADGRRDLMIGNNHGDASDPFPGSLSRPYFWDFGPPPTARTFAGNVSNLGLFEIESPDAFGAIACYAQVRAPGWQPVGDWTILPFDPVGSLGTTTRLVMGDTGDLHLVGSELRNGRAQVILRERIGGIWQPPQQVTQSTGHATEPSITALPGGDLGLVWSDSREARTKLFYRARVRGIWTPEQRLTDEEGDSFSPAIGSDARGLVQVAWLNILSGKPRVRMMVFGYASPFGYVHALSRPTDHPDAPAIAVGRNGRSFVTWSDVAGGPPTIWFARYHPDSGLSVKQRLADPTGNLAHSVQTQIDTAGTLHTTWIASGPGSSEIHYQRRPRTSAPSPADTTLVRTGGVVHGARLKLDPSGGAHLVFQSTVTSVSQIFYMRWLADRGWDQWPTDVTSVTEDSGQEPLIAAESRDRVTVLFLRNPLGTPHLFERRRAFDAPVPVNAVPSPPPRVRAPGMRVWPNPLRSGQALEFGLAGAAAPHGGVEVHDLAGRRVGVAVLRADGTGWRARLEGAATARWPAGVYFARVAGAAGPATRVVVLR